MQEVLFLLLLAGGGKVNRRAESEVHGSRLLPLFSSAIRYTNFQTESNGSQERL